MIEDKYTRRQILETVIATGLFLGAGSKTVAQNTLSPKIQLPTALQSQVKQDRFGEYLDLKIANVTQRMRYIKPGTFLMGSPNNEKNRRGNEGRGHEGPQHQVTISKGFWLANTPCTQELWQAVMGSNPSYFNEGNQAAKRPVENISFRGGSNNLVSFIQNVANTLPQGVGVRVPTEAEWEYACRAGTQTAYWWGDEWSDEKANGNKTLNGTSEVTRYPANPWGLHDMHGNVNEWCFDAEQEYTRSSEIDPLFLPKNDYLRVTRGGSWDYSSGSVRAAFRDSWNVVANKRNLGLRLWLRPF